MNAVKKPFDDAESQIRESQKKIDFDVKEFTVEHFVRRFTTGEIFIPEYQRDAAVWDEKKQGKFIESIFLGLPIPALYIADVYDSDDKDEEGNLEIIDGSQRIIALSAFVNNKLQLNELETLDRLNGLYFKDFPTSRQRRFLNSTIRLIQTSDKSDADIRFMMFERINGRKKGNQRGPFVDFIRECSQNPLFKQLTSFTEQAEKRGEPEELILRFFAYSEKYLAFKFSVTDFLNEYIREKNENNFDIFALKNKFQRMLEFVDTYFPNGFLREPSLKKTPRIRFEAISVGVILALETNPDLKPLSMRWYDSKEFIQEVSGGSYFNLPSRLKNRIEFVRDKLLGN